MARGAGSSGGLDAIGLTVTRTPLTPRSITTAALPVTSSAWNRRAGSSRVATTSSSDVSRSGSSNPVVSTRQSIPRPGQQLEQLARTQGGAAGGVQLTMHRGEERANGIPGEKPVMRAVDGARFWRNELNAIALVPSRTDQVPETLSRSGQSCRTLCMSGFCGCSFSIRCEKRPARRTCGKAVRGRLFFGTSKPGRRICRFCKACGMAG